jgi:hypothetical protein
MWVMYPERSDKAPVIITVHTIGELDDWTRALVDRLAADGYIAIAPELIDASSSDLQSRMAQVRQYAMSIPAANRQTGVLVIDGAAMPIASDSLLAPVLRIAASELRSGAATREWTRVLDYFETTFRRNK